MVYDAHVPVRRVEPADPGLCLMPGRIPTLRIPVEHGLLQPPLPPLSLLVHAFENMAEAFRRSRLRLSLNWTIQLLDD